MDPVTLAALLSGGSALAGSAMSGIGAGMSADKLAEEERKKREEDLRFRNKQFAQQTEMDKQQMGQSGIQLLMALQAQAQKQFQGQRFRDAMNKAVRS
jgi:hypothetical protein